MTLNSDNPQKNIIIQNNNTNKIASVSRKGWDDIKQMNPGLWAVQRLELPSDIVPCWYITENEKKIAIKNKEPFEKNRNYPSEYFKITNRIDNTFIEGYLGHIDLDVLYHNEDNGRTFTYFQTYEKREKVYFTFDRIALYEVIEILPGNPLKFILKRIDGNKTLKTNQAFMIMPFHNEILDTLYFETIKPLMNDLGINIYRADDFRDNDIIIDTIHKLIEESEFIIADTTIENKNSFYELGFASANGKEIITIQDKNIEQKLFFDRAHIRAILYDKNQLSNFQFDLKSTISSIRSRQ